MNTVLSLCTLLWSVLAINLDKMRHNIVQYLETRQDRPAQLLSTSSFTKCYTSLHYKILASKNKTVLTKPRINEAWKTAVPMSKLRIMIMFYTVPLSFFFFLYCVGLKQWAKGAFTGSHCVLEPNHCIIMCFADKWTTKVISCFCFPFLPRW